MTSRKYEQRVRAQTAGETRRRILDTLYQRLEDAPSESVSVDEIARTAQVSRSTIYLIFGSRAGLFEALSAQLIFGSGYDRILEAVRHPDAREHLRGAMHGGVQMYAAHRDVFRVLFSMAELDPDAVGGALQRHDHERANGIRYVAQRLAEQELLRSDVSVQEADDTLWLLASFDAFDLLYTKRGLPTDEVARILANTAERALCV